MKLTSFRLNLDPFCWSCSATDRWCTTIYSSSDCTWSRCELNHQLCNYTVQLQLQLHFTTITLLICDFLLTYFKILVPEFVTRFFLNHYINSGFWKVPLLSFPSSFTTSDQIWGNLYSMFLAYRSLVLSFPIASSNCKCVSSSLQNLQMRVGLPIPTTAKAMIAWTCAIRDYSPYHILFGADRQFIY